MALALNAGTSDTSADTNGEKTVEKSAVMNAVRGVTSDTFTMVAGGIMARAHAGGRWGPPGFGSAASDNSKGAGVT